MTDYSPIYDKEIYSDYEFYDIRENDRLIDGFNKIWVEKEHAWSKEGDYFIYTH